MIQLFSNDSFRVLTNQNRLPFLNLCFHSVAADRFYNSQMFIIITVYVMFSLTVFVMYLLIVNRRLISVAAVNHFCHVSLSVDDFRARPARAGKFHCFSACSNSLGWAGCEE